MQRYFLNVGPSTSPLTLPSDVAHHLTTVLRAQVGTEIEVVVVRTLPLAHLYVDGQLPVGILGVAERQGILHPRFR